MKEPSGTVVLRYTGRTREASSSVLIEIQYVHTTTEMRQHRELAEFDVVIQRSAAETEVLNILALGLG